MNPPRFIRIQDELINLNDVSRIWIDGSYVTVTYSPANMTDCEFEFNTASNAVAEIERIQAIQRKHGLLIE